MSLDGVPLIAVLNTLSGFNIKRSDLCVRYTAGSIFFEKNLKI